VICYRVKTCFFVVDNSLYVRNYLYPQGVYVYCVK